MKPLGWALGFRFRKQGAEKDNQAVLDHKQRSLIAMLQPYSSRQ